MGQEGSKDNNRCGRCQRESARARERASERQRQTDRERERERERETRRAAKTATGFMLCVCVRALVLRSSR